MTILLKTIARLFTQAIRSLLSLCIPPVFPGIFYRHAACERHRHKRNTAGSRPVRTKLFFDQADIALLPMIRII
jgi:hypothetical protein